MKEILNKIYLSFRKATKGEEALSHMIWWWGMVGYLIAFFIVNKLIRAIDFDLIDVSLSLIMVFYFSWHIYALKKCAPKKAKLTEEEKKKLKEDRHLRLGKSFMRKLLLQESITRWDSVFVAMMMDLLCITHFFGYVIK
jgi:predicted membrane protein